MTAAELIELVDAVAREKLDTQEWHDARFRLQAYMRGHAQDFVRLMEAAENLINSPDEDSDANAYFELQSALAAFKEQP